jgi:hypothetical protein
MDAVRSGMPLRAISRVIASCGRTTETAESMATWGGWFMVKYFAICAPYAFAGFDDVVIDSSATASDFG